MSKNLSAIRAICRQFLWDNVATDLVWDDDLLDTYIDECLIEISEFSPNQTKEVLTTIANSRELNIGSIEGLISVGKVEYPTGNTPRDFRNIIKVDDETIEIDTALNPKTGGSDTLTGTVTFTLGSATVTGSGTNFTGQLKAGYHIKKSTGTRWYRIYSIESNTSLTLAEASRDTGADVADKTQYCYETVYLYCNKSHQLTLSSSTLNPQQERALVLGATARAAMAKARTHIDKVNVGGARTPADMQSWGVGQLTLYRGELRKIGKPRTRREYPKN